MSSAKYGSVSFAEIEKISAISSPEVTIQKLNALIAYRRYWKAELRFHASHIRLLKAIRSHNEVHKLKEQSRWEFLRDEKNKLHQAWLDTPLWSTAWPKLRK